MEKEKFFDSTIKLFKEYRTKMSRGKVEDYDLNLSEEVSYRLWQLSFICGKIRHYEQIVTGPATKENVEEQNGLFWECTLLAEAFYFFAWRIMTITDHTHKHKYTKPLPGLEGLKDRAVGVRDVRNHLIEHPEGKKKEGEDLLMMSFSWLKDGPTLKNARPAGEPFKTKDRGFWINAQEFKDCLEELLQNAIKQ